MVLKFVIFVGRKHFLRKARLSGMKYFRGILSIYLALLIFLQPLLPFIEYAVFKDYIADNLCINRFEENSCCKGKCFLEEKVKEANDQKPESENKNLTIKSDPLVFILEKPKLHLSISKTLKSSIFHYENHYAFAMQVAVFHPPQFS